MSLAEVYRLAHTAECRLNISAARPDRNLRFVVGHLMHYESLRLRIVEIEHDIDRSYRARQRHQTSERSSMQQSVSADEEVIDDEDLYDDADGTDDALGLTRFPSGSSRPPPLVPDEDDEDDELAEPESPEEPDETTISQTLKRPADEELTRQMEKVRQCPCHGHTDAPHIAHVWELPRADNDKPGVTRAIAQEAG